MLWYKAKVLEHFEIYAEDEELLVVRLLSPVTDQTLEAMAKALPQALKGGQKAVLADRGGQPFQAGVVKSVDFGKVLGSQLEGAGIKIAIINRPHSNVASVLHAQIHKSGVALAQFDREAEARAWLKGGLN